MRDTHFRAALAVRGLRATAIMTDRRCGKSGNPELLLSRIAGRAHYGCAMDDYLPNFFQTNPPGARVSIATMPGHPRLFLVAPGDAIPQRVLTGIWRRWLWQTLGVLAVDLPLTTAAILIGHRRKGGSTPED